MKRETLLCAILLSSIVCSLPATAQESGYWHASSSTARSITGDLTLSGEKVLISFSTFAVARIRNLTPDELAATFDAADPSTEGRGGLYRLNIPASKKFLHHNALCGAEDTQWMAAYVAGRSLQLAFFSGPKVPVFTRNAIANSTDLCGTFSYTR